jgi:hypothetical protein
VKRVLNEFIILEIGLIKEKKELEEQLQQLNEMISNLQSVAI